MAKHVLDNPNDVSPGARLLRTGFAASADRSDGALLVRLHGELDLATAPSLADVVDAALEDRPPALALDLSQLTFVDSTGINVLVDAHRRAERDGCPFVLRAPRRAVLRALRLTGVDRVVPIEVENPSA